MDRTKALYGPRTQAYGETKYNKEILQVLDRTKALYGPRTQANGETKYNKEILQVLDRTKALYGLRTQAYGETNYLKEKLQVLDRTKALYGPTQSKSLIARLPSRMNYLEFINLGRSPCMHYETLSRYLG